MRKLKTVEAILSFNTELSLRNVVAKAIRYTDKVIVIDDNVRILNMIQRILELDGVNQV